MKAAVSAIEFFRRTLAYPDWRGRIFYGILRSVFACVPIRRRLVLDALEASFPEKDAAWRRKTLHGIYRHFSWMIVEFLAAVNNPALVSKMVVQVEGREIVDRLMAEKKGCFILTGHFANWEICGAWMPQNGYPMMPAARDADDPDFAELIEHYRSTLGEKTLRRVRPEQLWQDLPRVRQAAGDRAALRAMHYYGENERVKQMIKAVQANDVEAFKQILIASGRVPKTLRTRSFVIPPSPLFRSHRLP